MKQFIPVLLLCFCCASPAFAQAGPPPSLHGPGSLAGIWQQQGYMGSADHTPSERIARDINGKIPPLLPWARKLLDQRIKDANNGKLFANTITLCLPQGTPYMLFGAGASPVQIFEEQNQVTFIAEEENEVWFTYLNQKHPPADDLAPSYHGDSVDHWEGNTLVIDSVGLKTNTTLDQVGMPHSEAMHVITRITRVDANTLQFLVTIDDPKTFSAPWVRKVIYKKAKPGTRIFEYACDGNINAPEADGFQGFNTN